MLMSTRMIIPTENDRLLRSTPVCLWAFSGNPSGVKLSSANRNGVSWSRIGWLSGLCLRSCLKIQCKGGKWRFPAVKTQNVEGVNISFEEEEKAQKRRKFAAEETLDLLEWPRLCAAVAEFAGTASAKELCHALTLPSTREESLALLDETTAALELDNLLAGVLDFGALRTPVIKTGIDRASKGAVCTGMELVALATLLQFVLTLRRGIATAIQDNGERLDILLPIARLVEPMIIPQDVPKAIWSKVEEDGTVKDTAEVVDVDGRLCLIVPANKSDNIPGLLFQRGSGATAYLEPSAAVSLNNKLSEARAEVQNAEYEVLLEITRKIVPHLYDIQIILDIIVRLDVISARGKYSSNIGSSRPIFCTSIDTLRHHEKTDAETLHEISQQGDLLLNLRKARHPLLVEQHFQALKRAKSKFSSASKVLNRMKGRPGTSASMLQSAESAFAESEAELKEVEAKVPVPIDVQVSSGTRVVAITGPNTGGKTAAIKTIGLAALMAKAGLYVVARDPIQIPWFDAVFADIGDEQSLSQSLSTFSGHLMRIKRIKSESTGASLVLLDEVGAGTDPTEGATLGMAMLESFAQGGAGGSLLTFATTHHGELKTLKYNDTRFENASVEFDEVRLVPTYKLLWGIPGRSNAINIARRLGLPNEILAEAETLYGAESAEVNEVIMKLEEAKLNFDQGLEESESLFLEIKKLHSRLLSTAEALHDYVDELQLEKRDKLASIAASARSRLSAIARTKGPKVAASVLDDIEASTNLQSLKWEERSSSATKTSQPPDVAELKVGQSVYLPKLGRNVKVVEVNGKNVTVLSGKMQLKVKLKELQ
ncbi:hypothetical protein AXG93_4080s1100 [Marchantia polymorpha subsp. ruderalis]|uniref:DNA mismatch repair proteins mutS family domain-containing protein n=1 Tax=Marchantia polymorpha subsp. ruderalis TaxID=1480154 RepID=A0A176VUZ9_MARPO|nr:hypothetical protein AXG93_4080s1100 [Marchantia polymorpha subsp. ruderalis]